MKLDWNGPLVSARVRRASLAAVAETTEDAAQHARTQHEWSNESGKLEKSTVALEPEATAEGVSGRWGAGEWYAIDLEFGTVDMPARPFLRPAADATYPQLAGRIRTRYLA